MRLTRSLIALAVVATYALWPEAAPRICAQGRGVQPPSEQAQAARAPKLVFGSDAALVLNFVKTDRTADFEAVVARLKEALQKSDRPERKQQAAGWRVFKAAEPGPGGSVIYLFIIDQPLRGADYSVSTLLAEAFPAEAQALQANFVDSLTQGQTSINLMLTSTLKKQS